MSIKKHIPNFLTLCNLTCGILGIIICVEDLKFNFSSLEEQLLPVSLLIFLALIFDFLDGFVARLLKVTSTIGKELDSLADMITFGVLPALILYHLLENGTQTNEIFKYFVLLIPIFSALRLAKFNVDESQQYGFKGLPTPANAIFIASLPLILIYDESGWATNILKPYTLVAITIVFSLLLVAPIRLMAFKFHDYTFANNKFKYILIGLSVIMLITLKFYAIPLIIVLYILLSLLQNLLEKNEIQS